jgi:methylmalonyl-CoA mutase
MKPPEPGRPLRFVSAASLFDGHDAAINMIRRLLQSGGAEVVHLGHNRSVADIVRAAIAEDADAIAVSSYQGGHNEYFRYMVDMLREHGASHIRVVVGGGGTISPAEIAELEAYGVARIYTPEDGRRLGLIGMIEDVFARVARQRAPDGDGHRTSQPVTGLPRVDDAGAIAAAITLLEGGGEPDGADADDLRRLLSEAVSNPHTAPVIGLTGTGGAG